MEAQSRSGNVPRGQLQERNQLLRASPLSLWHSKNGLVHVATEARYIHKGKRTGVGHAGLKKTAVQAILERTTPSKHSRVALKKTLVATAWLTMPSLTGSL
jgi:hypothetical protein